MKTTGRYFCSLFFKVLLYIKSQSQVYEKLKKGKVTNVSHVLLLLSFSPFILLLRKCNVSLT